MGSRLSKMGSRLSKMGSRLSKMAVACGEMASDLAFSLRLMAYTITGKPVPALVHLLGGKVPVIIPTSTRLQQHVKQTRIRLFKLEIRLDTVDKRETTVATRMAKFEKVGLDLTHIKLEELGTKHPFQSLAVFRYDQFAIAYDRVALEAEVEAIREELAAIEGDLEAIRGL